MVKDGRTVAETPSATSGRGGGDTYVVRDNDNTKERIRDMMKDMSWNDKIGQMSQIEINMLLTEDKSSLRQDLLDHYIGELGIGSVLNNIVVDSNNNGNSMMKFWTISKFRQASIQIQETAKKYNRPPVIWGLDSVHGANYLIGTIMTPQPINIAASFNVSLAEVAGQYASYHTRQAGITWLFSPLVGIAWNSYWSRIYETFGEDPYLVGLMAASMTDGIQQQGGNARIEDGGANSIVPSSAAACGKHWVGYSLPHNGHDRAPSWIPTRHLFQYFIKPWIRVLEKSKVKTIMESYTEIDGVPNVANRYTLDYILRQRLEFDGVLITDYSEIYNLAYFHGISNTTTDAVLHSLQDGTVDISMIPWDPDTYRDSIYNHIEGIPPADNDSSNDNDPPNQQQRSHDRPCISQERINESVERVLRLKYDLNMFDEIITMENGGNFDKIIDNHPDSTDDKLPKPSNAAISDALDMTHQSIILAKNNGHTLPITVNNNNANPTKLKVLVTGPTSSSLSYQTGGWSGLWQGINPSHGNDWFTYGSTIYQAARKESDWDVTHECGVSITGGDCNADDEDTNDNENEDMSVMDKVKSWVGWGDNDDIDPSAYYSIERATSKATDKDLIIVCVGEESYTEKPGDIRSLRLPQGQYQLVEGLQQTKKAGAKLVLLYFGGRPKLLETMVVSCNFISWIAKSC